MAGEDGLKVKLASSADAETTVMARVRLFCSLPFETVRVTLWDPADVNMWLGFLDVLTAPLPKFQFQEIGPPVDVSVNCTVWPASGAVGLKEKEAVRDVAEETVIAWLDFAEPEVPLEIKVTV